MAYLHGLEWREIREALLKVGAPTSASELGVPREKLVECVLRAGELRKRFTILDAVRLNEELVLKILRETKIVD
jgi:Glycerol dehydrogenase and related enzymes